MPYGLKELDGGSREPDFFYTPKCEGVCLNTGQVYECVNESLCALCGEAKQRQSQKCNHGVKSSEREQEKTKEWEKRKIQRD